MRASQPAITCSKLTIETLEQGVKYAQNSSSLMFPWVLATTRKEVIKRDKVFKNGASQIWGRQSLKNLKWYGRDFFQTKREAVYGMDAQTRFGQKKSAIVFFVIDLHPINCEVFIYLANKEVNRHQIAMLLLIVYCLLSYVLII